METYSHYSRLFHDTLYNFSPVIEPLSVDEAFVDMTGCEHFYASSKDMATQIKERIYRESGLHASVGVAPNKFLAKLASDSRKPNGLVIIKKNQINRFLDPLPIERLWGVGPKTAQRLKEIGIRRVRDVQRFSEEALAARLGPSAAAHLVQLAHGIDPRPVEPPGSAKSISRETTFSWDIDDEVAIRQTLARLVADVGTRLRFSGQWAGKVTIKVRYPDFTTITRQRSLETSVQNDDRLFEAATDLWQSIKSGRPLRLLGVGVGDLTTVQQTSLFQADSQSDRISETMDTINHKFGTRVLVRGREWPKD